MDRNRARHILNRIKRRNERRVIPESRYPARPFARRNVDKRPSAPVMPFQQPPRCSTSATTSCGRGRMVAGLER
jgi:hypothetical protein